MLTLAFEKVSDSFVVVGGAELRRLVFGTRLAAAQLVEANVGHDAVEPSIKAALEAKPVEIAVHLQEGFLINVAGIFRALHQVEGQPQNVAVIAAHEFLESRSAATLRLGDEGPFVKLGKRSHRSHGGFSTARPAGFIGKCQRPSWMRHISLSLRAKPCCRISSNTLAEKDAF